MTAVINENEVNDRKLLGEALFNAADFLGISRGEAASIIGRERSGINRDGIDPKSKPGELALMFIRVYRGLYALVGGDKDNMQHWIATDNEYFGMPPKDMMASCQGLVQVVMYIDAIRGKV
ncbi:MbcA/ParS/Xre antitoxin family protein [Marinobacter shengliensis]|uniref:MbcA/ParS/Xre antitoxin family protein n=1 Tax=Marinobacter shengliensis TaxID=1389223 RepID=UPI001107FCCC|nr:MbcA/ParS/Xre antitoxin family protein [Marinobacter shengliensis]